MRLNETSDMMNSDDYKKRFQAEYYQLKIRLDGLNSMLDRWDKGELNFNPICPKGLLESQFKIMEKYVEILEARAKLEKVEL